MLTRPPTCGQEVVLLLVQFAPPVLASGAPIVVNSKPEEAVLSLDITVLLTKFTANESSRETPAPSQPATLLTMMLLVRVTEFQPQPARLVFGQTVAPFGKLTTSWPLTACRAMPPPLPLSAWLPIIRFALTTRLGPMPSLGPTEPTGGTQSESVVVPQGGSTSGAPMMIIAPPLAAMVGLLLWLNRNALCSMSPL